MEWKSEGVMDAESGDDDKDVLRSEWGGESKQTGKADGMNPEVDSIVNVMYTVCIWV